MEFLNGPQIDRDNMVLDKSPSETNKELQGKAKSHGKGDKDPLERKGASIERAVFGADKETLITKIARRSMSCLSTTRRFRLISCIWMSVLCCQTIQSLLACWRRAISPSPSWWMRFMGS